jgi:hypothetical protein
MKPNETVYIFVGGQGHSGLQGSSGNTKYGGWNGGGNALSDGGSTASNHGGGGGGTDIRKTINSEYEDRIIVAGGGGGAGGESSSWPLYSYAAKPGSGGGINGTGKYVNTNGDTRIGGGGGTQTSGGSGGTYSSSIGQSGGFGYGGDSATGSNTYPGGGGGGGWYGGGGGYDGGSPGGGGSGYIRGVISFKSLNITSETISGEEQIPNPLNPKETITGNTGPGYARITALQISISKPTRTNPFQILIEIICSKYITPRMFSPTFIFFYLFLNSS